MKKISLSYSTVLLAFAGWMPFAAHAQVVIEDTLNGDRSTYDYWKVSGGACLTARLPTSGGTSKIPGCMDLPYYAGQTQLGGATGLLPDNPTLNNGALRLTNGGNYIYQTGSIISNDPFPTNKGVQVTFKTVTYGGNNYNGTGADGIAFFLVDALKGVTTGATGGSLGYACSNTNEISDGVAGGYLGIGIDEFGNFSNAGADVGAASPMGGFKANYIAVRGAGNVRWAELYNEGRNPNYPDSADHSLAVRQTCKYGVEVDMRQKDASGVAGRPTSKTVMDYALLANPQPVLGTIGNQQNVALPLRANAIPLAYNLTITQDGLLSVFYSNNGGALVPLISKQDITVGNGDLPSNFLFGFTAGTGGGTNIHEITCFKAAQINVASTSAGSNGQQNGQVQAGSQLFLAFSHPLNSWGQITASNLLANTTTGLITVAANANWDANCVLTGGVCDATDGTNVAQDIATRNVFTWNGGTGISFQYANLTEYQKNAIAEDAVTGAERIAFLRGDRSNEFKAIRSGKFRRRDGLLGDIVNSSPTWVGRPGASYDKNGVDKLTGRTISEFGNDYVLFANKYQTRKHVLYVGANDGMLHGFSAGSYNTDLTFNAANNTGKELFAYMPAAAVISIHNSTTNQLDYSSANYAHNFYVDATPTTGDVYYQGGWHTLLVGGMGAGGNPGGAVNGANDTAKGVIFGLDITNPEGFTNAAAVVKGEWDSTTLTCSNVALCGKNLGSTYGTPQLRLMHDGNYAAIFGNGRNSVTGAAGIFIGSINRDTGAVTFRFLQAGTADASNKNGIDFVDAVDLDSDRVADYVYAGDSAGHLWKFNLTSSNPDNWAAASAPLFTTAAGQPISTKVTVVPTLTGTSTPRLIVVFGTGRQTPQTLNSAATYATGSQALYGIWDWDMAAWNALGSVQYAKLTAPQTVAISGLQQQTMTTVAGGTAAGVSGYRTSTANTVCWKDTCTTGAGKYGWVSSLPTATEQILYNLTVLNNILVVNSVIPAQESALTCDAKSAAGYTLALSTTTGGSPSTPVFSAGNGIENSSSVVGLGLGAVGTPQIFTQIMPAVAGGTTPGPVGENGAPAVTGATTSVTTVISQLGNGKADSRGGDFSQTGVGKRLNWVKLR